MMSKANDLLDSVPGLYRGPGGAAAVIRNGQVESQCAWGYADLDRRIPVTTKTHFPICSISKQMLCLVIASLRKDPTSLMEKSSETMDEQLSAELKRLLPELMDSKDSELTIAHLVNMQSGIRDYWAMTVLWGAKPDDPFSIAHDAPRALERTKTYHFATGTEFSYSNVNFHIVARAVETVSGQSLGQLLAERVFKPAGMKNAALAPNTAGPPLPIIGYEGSEKIGYLPAVNRIEWSGDAGIVATLEDMIAYESWLETTYAESGSLYNTIAERQKYTDGSPAVYGNGLVHMKLAGKDTIGHSGGLRGFRLQRLHVPSEHLSVVVLFNHEANVGAAAEHILKLAFEVVEPPKTTPIKPASEWKGSFLDEKTQLLIQVDVNEANELSISIAGAAKMQLTDENHAEHRAMTADIYGDMLHVNHMQANKQYHAQRVKKAKGSEGAPPSKDDYAGKYVCEEVESTFNVSGTGAMLYGSFDGYMGNGPIHLMKYVGEDVWLLSCPRSMDAPAPGEWTVVFKRGSEGKIEGVTVGCWLARKIDFVRK